MAFFYIHTMRYQYNFTNDLDPRKNWIQNKNSWSISKWFFTNESSVDKMKLNSLLAMNAFSSEVTYMTLVAITHDSIGGFDEQYWLYFYGLIVYECKTTLRHFIKTWEKKVKFINNECSQVLPNPKKIWLIGKKN